MQNVSVTECIKFSTGKNVCVVICLSCFLNVACLNFNVSMTVTADVRVIIELSVCPIDALKKKA